MSRLSNLGDTDGRIRARASLSSRYHRRCDGGETAQVAIHAGLDAILPKMFAPVQAKQGEQKGYTKAGDQRSGSEIQRSEHKCSFPVLLFE